MSGHDMVASCVNVGVVTELQPDRSGSPTNVEVSVLFRAQREPMARLAYVLTHHAEVSEEIVQDAFIKLHANWGRVDNRVGYLRTCVVNGCHSYHRRLRLERRLQPRREESTDLASNELRDALAKLVYPRRAALALRYFCDLSEDEIARIIGCRPATVRSRIARGLADLRKEISP
jgi:RNA polymerase sigma factor (sigma-70 family)